MPGTGSTYVRGLWLASGLSTASVITDVFRKRALEPNEFYSTCFRLRGVATCVFGVALSVAIARHGLHPLHSIGPLMGVAGAEGPAWLQLLIYMVIDASMVAAAQLLYFRALQTSEMSYFLPFVGLTPVLLIPTGFFLIGELPLPHQIAGVLLIVSGSLAMNGNRLQLGWRKFLVAPFERRASRYALIIALLFALSNPVDKVLVEMSDPLMYAFVYNLCLCGLFGGLTLREGTMLLPGVRGTTLWVVLGGCFDAATLLLQFSAYRYLPVILVIAIKRAGVILSVLAGWLIFGEKEVGERLFATVIMASGILLIYLPLSRWQDVLVTACGLGAFAVRVAWRRRTAVAEEVQVSD